MESERNDETSDDGISDSTIDSDDNDETSDDGISDSTIKSDDNDNPMPTLVPSEGCYLYFQRALGMVILVSPHQGGILTVDRQYMLICQYQQW